METRYVIKLDNSLSRFIKERIEEFFTIEKFAKVLDIASPNAPDIVEFKKKDFFVSISFIEYHGQKVEVVLESPSDGALALFVKAVRWLAADLLISFLEGLPTCKEGIENIVHEHLDILLTNAIIGLEN